MFWICLFLPLTSAASFWGSSSSGSAGQHVAWPCQDQSCLNNLYNSPVSHAEFVRRPLSSMPSGSSFLDHIGINAQHEGVKLTLDNGDQYLLHKGHDFGKSSDTVITPASNMKSGWQTVDSSDVYGKTVDDFMKHANPGTSYNLFGDNCQDAARKTWKINTEHN